MKIRFVMAIVLALSVAAGAKSIDLRSAEGSGVRVLRNFHGGPDEHGVMRTYTVDLPGFEKMAYYWSLWWPAAGNRVRPFIYEDVDELQEGGMFALLKLDDGDYLAILPVGGNEAYSWFHTDGEKMTLKFGTHGTAAIEGDFPLYAWARAADPYEACYTVWNKALNFEDIDGNSLMRDEKDYPEVFEYLGWCSWEHYKGRISSENMARAMKDIEKSGIGIRYFLIDNGHFDSRTLAPNDKFSDGYKPLTDLCRDDKIKWFGVWFAYMGNKDSMMPPVDIGDIEEHMMATASGRLQPKETIEDATAFFEYLYSYARADDADFVKVDFSTYALPFYAGLMKPQSGSWAPPDNSGAIGNPYAAAVNLFRAFEEVTDREMNGLMNCNWHITANLFNMNKSATGRCSEDYKVGNIERARGHIYHSYSSTPWLGQLAWGDHDMFHSNDKFAGRLMAVSKAASGGPVYLSDEPTAFVREAIEPLIYDDGELLRPLAPAGPLRDDLFYALGDERLYRAVAPLNNRTAAIVVYNLTGGVGDDEESLSTVITPKDYSSASAMLQPYPGPWQVPDEGLLVYDWYSGKARKLKRSYDVSIKGFGDRLLQISPIEKGWSVIGRADKYMSAAAVEVLSVRDDAIRLRMDESGPLLIWSEKGRPGGKHVNFVDLGGGLYRGEMQHGKRDRTGIITR